MAYFLHKYFCKLTNLIQIYFIIQVQFFTSFFAGVSRAPTKLFPAAQSDHQALFPRLYPVISRADEADYWQHRLGLQAQHEKCGWNWLVSCYNNDASSIFMKPIIISRGRPVFAVVDFPPKKTDWLLVRVGYSDLIWCTIIPSDS